MVPERRLRRVFWTRLGAQLGLFLASASSPSSCCSATSGWRAGCARPTGGGGAPFRICSTGSTRPPARVGPGGPVGRRQPRRSAFEPDDMPDLTPDRRIVLVGHGRARRADIGAAVAARGRRSCSGRTASRSRPMRRRRGRPDLRPRHRFFLFELPFLRLVQSLFNGLCRRRPDRGRRATSSRRSRGGLVFVDAGPGPPRRSSAGCSCCRSRSATSSTSTSSSYSTRRRRDRRQLHGRNAQFFAYDVLTVLSGLAAALLVGGAFTRLLWPLGLASGVWFVGVDRRRPALPGGDPAPHRRAQRVRPGRALHREQHRDDPAGVRPRRLGGRGVPRARRR